MESKAYESIGHLKNKIMWLRWMGISGWAIALVWGEAHNHNHNHMTFSWNPRGTSLLDVLLEIEGVDGGGNRRREGGNGGLDGEGE